ncbi:MAG TPA: hypothetical protein VMW27_07875 [Thermoanaerobaculia bacterium]|nr:hypothetical protein [Thermoanaerobaculia bacterium]
MNALQKKRLELAPVRRPRRSEVEPAKELRWQAQRLKHQLAVFGKSARELHRRLDLRIPEEEVEDMRTPAANLLGTLECLIADDLMPVYKKLEELIDLLNDRSVAEVGRVDPGCGGLT